ncbi:MAG: HAD family hydrolase [Actinomycetales bacterium]|nr:HAD family hydrolase [Actinomycetales bacterium]
MPIKAVIFDWGGTLTPWHPVDLRDKWRAYAKIYNPDEVEELAEALHIGEQNRWARQLNTMGEVGTGMLDELFLEAGVDVTHELHHQALESYLAAWDPHTYTDEEAVPLLEALRGQGIRTAVLSNTMWPRWHHERVLERDGVLHLFDYLLFTSDMTTGKPHRTVFADVLYHLDVQPEEAAFVGDRMFDDIHGAQSVGMRGIWIPHSQLPPAESPDLGVVPAAIAQRLGDVLEIVNAWNQAETA